MAWLFDGKLPFNKLLNILKEWDDGCDRPVPAIITVREKSVVLTVTLTEGEKPQISTADREFAKKLGVVL